MPTIDFDGPNKIIEIGYDASTTQVNATEIYSAWKVWVTQGNAQYQPAFAESVGGNPLGAGVNLDAYLFLRNDLGWRIRPADMDHTLVVQGQLFGESAADALYLSRPGRTVNVREQQSSRSQVIAVDAGGGGTTPGPEVDYPRIQREVGEVVIPHIWAAS